MIRWSNGHSCGKRPALSGCDSRAFGLLIAQKHPGQGKDADSGSCLVFRVRFVCGRHLLMVRRVRGQLPIRPSCRAEPSRSLCGRPVFGKTSWRLPQCAATRHESSTDRMSACLSQNVGGLSPIHQLLTFLSTNMLLTPVSSTTV